MPINSIIPPDRLDRQEFSNDEIARYSRHLIMPEVTLEGQKKLKAASILCIGTGGLGSPIALYLAAAGVGRLVVPQSLARLHHRRDLTYRPLTDAPGSGVGLAWPDAENTELMEEFIGIVRGRTVNSSRTPRRDATPAPAKKRRPVRRGTRRR